MEKKKEMDLREEEMVITEHPNDFQILSVMTGGRKYQTTFTKKFAGRKKWERPDPGEIKSFIPGTVEKIMVKKGAPVKKNDELMSYIAMKMRNIIRAPFEGTVEAIFVKEGDLLPKGTPMFVIKQKPAAPTKEKLHKNAKEQRKGKPTKLEKAVKNLTRTGRKR
ncbi:MAG: acetyl-CoA carboxylase biotin carboxyl carrier protein subunit [Prevotellaceae bacterium]|jgi:biotin carboxyl carrier protein|nr:acetyl-CoA carboxylase biotin carboxyl carrier protein subunit [Prevotellaceae bacterium]